ncbi:Regulator of G-protein signaling 7, partial [Chytridiales sp. JEL 0842]
MDSNDQLSSSPPNSSSLTVATATGLNVDTSLLQTSKSSPNQQTPPTASPMIKPFKMRNPLLSRVSGNQIGSANSSSSSIAEGGESGTLKSGLSKQGSLGSALEGLNMGTSTGSLGVGYGMRRRGSMSVSKFSFILKRAGDDTADNSGSTAGTSSNGLGVNGSASDLVGAAEGMNNAMAYSVDALNDPSTVAQKDSQDGPAESSVADEQEEREDEEEAGKGGTKSLSAKTRYEMRRMAIFEDVVCKMRGPEEPLEIKTRTKAFKSYPNSFTGSDFCNWLIRNFKLLNTTEATRFGQEMLDYGYIIQIDLDTKFTPDSGTLYIFQTSYLWPSFSWVPSEK